MIAASPDGPTRSIRDGPDAGRISEDRRSYARPGSVWVTKPSLPEFGETVIGVGGNDLWIVEVVTWTVEVHNRCIQG